MVAWQSIIEMTKWTRLAECQGLDGPGKRLPPPREGGAQPLFTSLFSFLIVYSIESDAIKTDRWKSVKSVSQAKISRRS